MNVFTALKDLISDFYLIPEVVKPKTILVLLNTEVNNPVNSPHCTLHKRHICDIHFKSDNSNCIYIAEAF